MIITYTPVPCSVRGISSSSPAGSKSEAPLYCGYLVARLPTQLALVYAQLGKYSKDANIKYLLCFEINSHSPAAEFLQEGPHQVGDFFSNIDRLLVILNKNSLRRSTSKGACSMSINTKSRPEVASDRALFNE